MTSNNYVLEMKNIKKRFGGTQALKGVDMNLKQGEVLGVIGENGAGKSTLMKILSGVYTKDEGEIFIDGKPTNILSTEHAQEQGISIIYQELSVFLDLSVIDNVFIHREKTFSKNNGLISKLNTKEMKAQTQKIFDEQLGIDIDVDKKASNITLAQRQLVEIARSLCSKSKIIIMDEPTTALETEERNHLFNVIKNLKAKGTSVIYISHQLEDVLDICDRIMILRDGSKVADSTTEKMDVNDVIDLMIGKSLNKQYPKEDIELGETILEIEDLSKEGKYKNISFELHKGEVLGIAGLVGCGKNDVVRSIFGINKYDKGIIKLYNNAVDINSIDYAKKNKIAFLPGERKVEGIFSSQDVKWNTTIASLNRISNVLINGNQEKDFSHKYVNDFGIKVGSINHPITSLSGGNQQKVMLARWLMTEPDILILEEPTRGIDVNAKAEVYKLIMEFVKQGKGVIIVSSESQELLGICDNILVMHNGKISAKLDARTSDEETVAYYSQKSEGVVENEEQYSIK